MRKFILMSTVAAWTVTGGAGVALAQKLEPEVFEGTLAAPLPVQAANNANNSSPEVQTDGVMNPVPGSIVVHLNARTDFFGAGEWSSLNRTSGTGAANTGAAKLSSFSTIGFIRLYPGVDGITANGLRYGASVEIREDFGPSAGSSLNSGSSANTFSNTLFVRRAFVYLANSNFGLVRLGQGDGPIGLFDLGITTFQNFDTGGWDGDDLGAIPLNSQPVFPFVSLQGAEYASSKFVYVSPRIAGFDFAASYAPNNSTLSDGPVISNLNQPTSATLTTCAFAASGCVALSSSSAANDGARFRDFVEAGVRYRANFDGVGIYGFGIYSVSNHVNFTGTAPNNNFTGLNFGDFGLALSYGGFTFGGHGTVGSYNGVLALRPVGGVPATAWLVGAQYTNGPITIGASYYDYQSQGFPGLVHISQRDEQGFAAGSTYNVAPGLVLYASYLYGARHQGDFDFATGAVGTENNNVKAQEVTLGTLIRW